MISALTIGDALVLHTHEQPSRKACEIALSVPATAEEDLVVLDLRGPLPVGLWDSVARALPAGGRGLRLVICGAGHDSAALLGQWLSDRLGSPVSVPYGPVLRTASGSLYAEDGAEAGWVRHRPGETPRREGRRYPRPDWDDAVGAFRATSAYGVAEPLPGGVWIRATHDELATTAQRRRLYSDVPCLPSTMTVVLGSPGTAPVTLDDVARFWLGVPEEWREAARFIGFGPVRLPEGATLGQALADTLGAPVICYTGLPIGRARNPDMRAVTPDGAIGRRTYARELGYLPRAEPGGVTPVPHILSFWVPPFLGEQIGPVTYRYAHDVAVEVVQSGLWVRPLSAPSHAVAVRARVAGALGPAVLVDDSEPALLSRLRSVARDLVARLDDSGADPAPVRVLTLVPPTPAPPVAPAVSEPAGPAVPGPAVPAPAVRAPAVPGRAVAGPAPVAPPPADSSAVRPVDLDVPVRADPAQEGAAAS